MADLTARFRMIDEMSAALERVARSGQDMTDRIGRGAADLDNAMAGISLRVSGVARTIDGVAASLDQAEDAQADLTAAMERAAQATQELSENENVSAEAKDELARASQEAEEALNELAEAQERTQQAMAEYDQLLASGTASLDDLEQAAQSAANASDELDAAHRRATRATEELADATERAADEAEEGGHRGQQAAEQLANTLAAAGVTALVHEMADAFMEASNAAAEFQMGVMKISTIADTTNTSLGSIQSGIMSLSMDTGDSVNELSEAVYSAISASVDTASAVEFTATATKLAAGGFTTSATSVDVLTTALNAYGLEARYAENISDMLITTQNLGKTTVDELAASVGKVIPLASAYGVEMDNLSAAYAELTKGGIATAESGTYLKSMLNELGDSGSTVSSVLMEQTGSSFSYLMQQGYSLGDVMEVLGESVNGDAGAFNELWSSSEAGIGALSLYNAGAEQFNTTLNAMQNSAGATAQAYEIMNNTTADAAEDLSNAAANLQISIGQQINPLIDKLYDGGTKILNFITQFTQEHPVVTKAVAAIGIGLGVAAVAMVGFTFATTTAIPAIVSFGVSLNAALGPIGWVAVGITALVAAGAALAAMFEEDMGETAGMTATTREQYYELQSLTDEYERACEQYGETSEEANRLKYQVDDLSATFEANRQTVEEFTAEVDALCESVHRISDDFDSAMSSIQAQEVGSLALIQKYDDLAGKANRTAAEEQALAAVTKQLSSQYPELAEQLNTATGGTDDYVAALKRACEQEAEEQRQQQAQETYIEALRKRAELTDELAKAQENVNLEQARMDDMSGWAHFWTGGEWDDLEAYQTALEDLNAAMAENDAIIAEIEANWDAAAQAEEAAAQATVSWQEAAATAYENVKTKVEELCAAYDEAYQSAVDSFSGQFGLFDEASMKSEDYMNSTVANAQAALDSQLAYWESYGANIETLKNTSASDLGITQENYEALMAYAQDGSEQAAGLAASMAAAIEAGDAEAVATLANTVAEVTAKQEEIAAATADWQTGFTEQMDAIEKEMQDTVDGMNLSEEAAASATATINSYAEQILAGKSNAVAAAQDVANAVALALSSAKTSVNLNVSSASVPGHAGGTTDAEDVFIAGEEGPELIVGAAHSTVFPASETDRLINAVNSTNDKAGDDLERSLDKTEDALLPSDQGRLGKAENTSFTADETDRLINTVSSTYDNTGDDLERSISKTDNTFLPADETAHIINAATTDYDNAGDNLERSLDKTENTPFTADDTDHIISAATSDYGNTGDDLERSIRKTDSTAFPAAKDDRIIDVGGDLEQLHSVGRAENASFTLDDADRIINAVTSNYDNRNTSYTLSTPDTGAEVESAGEQSKHIILEIAGGSPIEVGGSGGASKEEIVEILLTNLRPALLNLMKEEIFEEGDGSYEY